MNISSSNSPKEKSCDKISKNLIEDFNSIKKTPPGESTSITDGSTNGKKKYF